MKAVTTLGAPTPRGHYAQAIVHGGIVYVAGQLPLVPGDPERKLTGFEEQARRVIDNVLNVLEAAGSGPDQLLKVNVYIADMAHWPIFNEIYAEMIGLHKPARTVIPTEGLHYGYLLEMDAIAAVKG